MSNNKYIFMIGALIALMSACSSKKEPSNKAEAPVIQEAPKEPPKETTKETPMEHSADALSAPSDVAAPPADAQKTASGLATKVLRPGTGTAHPGPTSTVRVHYTGWTTDGVMFDSSVARGQPIAFGLNQVIAGWTEGVQLMVVGEKRRLWIPENLAYQGRPGAPAGMLVFDVELLDIPK